MNKDINKTLMALVPILRMNGENVTNIEAVHDWYKAGDREYMKEVAEITYDNGTVRYADIGCDSNLTAIYDVIAVIQQIKPKSEAIERIERGVYSLPSAQPEPIKINIDHELTKDEYEKLLKDMADAPIVLLPSVQPEIIRCKDCEWFRKEYGWNCIEYTVCGVSPTHHPIRTEEDFCSRAERRTDETD